MVPGLPEVLFCGFVCVVASAEREGMSSSGRLEPVYKKEF
jgi:hypothetical protein